MAYNQYNNNYNRNNNGKNNRNNGNYSGNNNQNSLPPVIDPKKLPEDYIDLAEKVMRGIMSEGKAITTSKIRRLYNLITEIYNEEYLRTEENLSQESISAIGLARIRFAYESGRDNAVKQFILKAELLAYLKGIGNDRESFIRFSRYMEALVAYHKFMGGKEN